MEGSFQHAVVVGVRAGRVGPVVAPAVAGPDPERTERRRDVPVVVHEVVRHDPVGRDERRRAESHVVADHDVALVEGGPRGRFETVVVVNDHVLGDVGRPTADVDARVAIADLVSDD